MDRDKIKVAQAIAYANAGQNAFFGNGFNAGVEFAEEFYTERVEFLEDVIKQLRDKLYTGVDNEFTLMCDFALSEDEEDGCGKEFHAGGECTSCEHYQYCLNNPHDR
jgi:hypothetical protein